MSDNELIYNLGIIVAQSDDPNKKFHFNQLTKAKKARFFKEILKHPTKIDIWTEGMESKGSLESYELQNKSSDQNHFDLKKMGGFSKRFTISKLINKRVFVRVREGKILYFFTGFFEFVETDRYIIKNISHAIFSSQRRQNYRLIIRNNTKGFLIIEDLKFPLMDISARGLAFNTPPKVANYFVKKPIVKDVQIILNDEQYLINEAKLIRTKPSKDELLSLPSLFT